MAKQGMAVYSPEYIQAGTAVVVEYKGILIFAEVVYCQWLEAGGCRAGIHIDQALATSTVTVNEAEREIRALSSEMSDSAYPLHPNMGTAAPQPA